MIEFKIVTTPDKTQQLLYQHEGEELVIGNEEGDMILDDPQIGGRQLRIYFENGQPLVDNLDPNVPVRLNGREVEAPTPIKERDTITMARSQIQIVKLDLQPALAPEVYVHPQAEVRFKDGTAEKAILDVLEHLMTSTPGVSSLAKTQSGAGAPAARAPGSMPKPPVPPIPGGVKPPLPPPIPKRPG